MIGPEKGCWPRVRPSQKLPLRAPSALSKSLMLLVWFWVPTDAGRRLQDETLVETWRRELVATLPRPERRRGKICGSLAGTANAALEGPDAWNDVHHGVCLRTWQTPRKQMRR